MKTFKELERLQRRINKSITEAKAFYELNGVKDPQLEHEIVELICLRTAETFHGHTRWHQLPLYAR